MVAIEDLHGRLKSNIDTIQQLNEQLKAVNRENMKMKADVERERAARHRLSEANTSVQSQV